MEKKKNKKNPPTKYRAGQVNWDAMIEDEGELPTFLGQLTSILSSTDMGIHECEQIGSCESRTKILQDEINILSTKLQDSTENQYLIIAMAIMTVLTIGFFGASVYYKMKQTSNNLLLDNGTLVDQKEILEEKKEELEIAQRELSASQEILKEELEITERELSASVQEQNTNHELKDCNRNLGLNKDELDSSVKKQEELLDQIDKQITKMGQNQATINSQAKMIEAQASSFKKEKDDKQNQLDNMTKSNTILKQEQKDLSRSVLDHVTEIAATIVPVAMDKESYESVVNRAMEDLKYQTTNWQSQITGLRKQNTKLQLQLVKNRDMFNLTVRDNMVFAYLNTIEGSKDKVIFRYGKVESDGVDFDAIYRNPTRHGRDLAYTPQHTDGFIQLLPGTVKQKGGIAPIIESFEKEKTKALLPPKPADNNPRNIFLLGTSGSGKSYLLFDKNEGLMNKLFTDSYVLTDVAVAYGECMPFGDTLKFTKSQVFRYTFDTTNINDKERPISNTNFFEDATDLNNLSFFNQFDGTKYIDKFEDFEDFNNNHLLPFLKSRVFKTATPLNKESSRCILGLSMKSKKNGKHYIIWDLPGSENALMILQMCVKEYNNKESPNLNDQDLEKFMDRVLRLSQDGNMDEIISMNITLKDDTKFGQSCQWKEKTNHFRKIKKTGTGPAIDNICQEDDFYLNRYPSLKEYENEPYLYTKECTFKNMDYMEQLWYIYMKKYFYGKDTIGISEPFDEEEPENRKKLFKIIHTFELIKQSVYIALLLQNISFGVMPSQWINRKPNAIFIKSTSSSSPPMEDENGATVESAVDTFTFDKKFDYKDLESTAFLVPLQLRAALLGSDLPNICTLAENDDYDKEYEQFIETLRHKSTNLNDLELYKELEKVKYFQSLAGNDMEIFNGILCKARKNANWNNRFPLNYFLDSEKYYCITNVIGRMTPAINDDVTRTMQQNRYMEILFNTIGVSDACVVNTSKVNTQYNVGMPVLYTQTNGKQFNAVIEKIHHDDQKPYYTIKFNNQTRETEASFLEPNSNFNAGQVTEASPPQPSAPLPPQPPARLPPQSPAQSPPLHPTSMWAHRKDPYGVDRSEHSIQNMVELAKDKAVHSIYASNLSDERKRKSVTKISDYVLNQREIADLKNDVAIDALANSINSYVTQ